MAWLPAASGACRGSRGPHTRRWPEATRTNAKKKGCRSSVCRSPTDRELVAACRGPWRASVPARAGGARRPCLAGCRGRQAASLQSEAAGSRAVKRGGRPSVCRSPADRELVFEGHGRGGPIMGGFIQIGQNARVLLGYKTPINGFYSFGFSPI